MTYLDVEYAERVGACPLCGHHLSFANLRGECRYAGANVMHEAACGCDHSEAGLARARAIVVEASLPVAGYLLIADDGSYFVRETRDAVTFQRTREGAHLFATEDEARALAESLPIGFTAEPVYACSDCSHPEHAADACQAEVNRTTYEGMDYPARCGCDVPPLCRTAHVRDERGVCTVCGES